MTEIPKQDLLAKLLRMSTSPNDGEALTAIRKANSLLKDNGWDWDKLLAGKIRIAADPFANLGTPHNEPAPSRAPAPPRPTPPPRPAAYGAGGGGGTTWKQPPPPPPPPLKPFEPYSHRSTNGQTNMYPGNCYCCGYSVSAKDGKLFIAAQFNKRVADAKKKYTICTQCDNDRHAFIDSKPAAQIRTPRPYAGPAPTASDL